MRANVRQLIHISVHACTHMYVNVYACKRVSRAQNRFGYRPESILKRRPTHRREVGIKLLSLESVKLSESRYAHLCILPYLHAYRIDR